MFTELKKAYEIDRENHKSSVLFYIENGFYPTWEEEHRNDADRGIKEYSTDTRWTQYKSGKIDRVKAVELAQKRASKQIDKETEKGLAKIEAVSNAPELTTATVNVLYNYNRTWGYNPAVDVWTDNGKFYGTASGCGYDKQSAAVAQAFNADFTMLKVLYTIKEKALAEGQTDESRTTCTGHDNQNIIGYGSGYSVLPYYEGGVGVECFFSILKKAGYTISAYYGKRENNYRIEKAGA